MLIFHSYVNVYQRVEPGVHSFGKKNLYPHPQYHPEPSMEFSGPIHMGALIIWGI